MSDSTEYVTIRVTKEQAKRFVNVIVPSKRPATWSRRSYSSYYNESYAGVMKDALDQMIQDKQDIVYKYEDWNHISENSLYLRVNHSQRFLKDFMDPEFKYSSWLEKCETKRKKHGIVVSLRPEYRATFKMVQTNTCAPVLPPTKKDWRSDLDKFIDSSKPGEKFSVEDLALTREEVLSVKQKFAGLDQFAFSITHTAIKAINTQ